MLGFREVWAHDFEFVPDDRNGTRRVVCLVAKELVTGRTLRVWEDELRAMPAAPFSTGPDAVAVAHNASAEIACFDELGWQHPSNVLDTVAIHRVYTNGAIGDYGLLAALTAWGLEGIAPEEKHEMRDLILSGGPWSPEQREAILAYCESDVVALDHLLRAMEPGITAEPERLPQELLRGEYMRAVAHIERIGIPFDAERLTQIRENREDIARHLIEKVDCDFGVYDGLRFDSRRFKAFLLHHEIAWPTYPSGMPMLDASIFKDMCRINPMLEPLRQLRKSVATLKAMKLDAGDDGRSRYPVMPFASKTGRNQPKAARFVFGQPKWLRSLIMPAEGRALAYIDYSSQEVAIAAALAGDELLLGGLRQRRPLHRLRRARGADPAGR